MGNLLRFQIHHHSLNLYGSCDQLKTEGSCPQSIKN
jgi:hypothetical protein